MSESKEHKKRYNQKLQYIAEFEKWLDKEPPIILLISWIIWKRKRPRKDDYIRADYFEF